MDPTTRIARVMELLEAPPSGWPTGARVGIGAVAGIAVAAASSVWVGPAPGWWLGGLATILVGAVSGLLAAAGLFLITPPRQAPAARLASLFPGLSTDEIETTVIGNAKALKALARAGDALIDTELRAVVDRVARMAGTMIASFATDPDNARETQASLPDLLAQSHKLIARYADHEARSAVDDQFGPFRQAVLSELGRIEDAFAHRRAQELLDAARETEALSRD
jgi:hypothetical protein